MRSSVERQPAILQSLTDAAFQWSTTICIQPKSSEDKRGKISRLFLISILIASLPLYIDINGISSGEDEN